MDNSIQQTTAVAEYSPTAAALADLNARLNGVVYDVTAKEGMLAATKDRAEVRGYRVNLEKLRKEIKAPALERCQLIDSEAKSITAQLSALENPIDEQIKKEEHRKEEIKLAVERAEAERLKAIEDARLAEIANHERLLREAEQANLAAERAEVEKMRADAQKIIAAQHEASRKHELEAAAARRAIEDEARAARLKIENEQRQAQIEIDNMRREIEQKARAQRDAEDAAAKIERDRIEAAQRELDRKEHQKIAFDEAKAKAKRDKEDEEKRQINFKKMALLDGRQLLETFLEQYGALAEFSEPAAAIRLYLQMQEVEA